MKSNGKGVLKACLIISGIILFCFGAVWLMDQRLNGVFKEWFYSRFVIVTQYPSNETVGISFKNWPELKQFFINIFIAFVIILILCTVLSAYFYARHRSKKDIRFILSSMSSIMKPNNDDLTLPRKYSEIETQLIKIKAISQKHQQLVETEMQRKNDLITYLAHDLKTPLASVIGYLSLLDESQDMPIVQKAKYVGIALNKAYRLEDLINEFFEITRFNLQSIVLNKGKINLTFMLQQMADEFYPMLAPQMKQVTVHVPDVLTLLGDADKLARVFNNILRNAIVYSYDSSVIDIFAVQQEGNIVITFTNQGDQIPLQKLDTIFEKFYRLDSSRSTNKGGAGLGLAIAKEIVTAHGGMITAESSKEHTVFSVMLPISDTEIRKS